MGPVNLDTCYQQTHGLQSFSVLLCATFFFCFWRTPHLPPPHTPKTIKEKPFVNSPWHFIQNGSSYELQSVDCMNLYMLTVLPLFKTAVLFWVRSFSPLVSIVHDRLHVVSWEESGDAIADTFKPAIIVFLDNIDDGSFHEGQLILLILGIVVDGDNWEKWRRGKVIITKTQMVGEVKIAWPPHEGISCHWPFSK